MFQYEWMDNRYDDLMLRVDLNDMMILCLEWI